MTHDVADIPFDLRHYPHIIYGNRLTDLRSELEARVRHFVAQHRAGSAALQLDVDVNGTHLGHDDITVPIDLRHGCVLELRFTVRNVARDPARTVECQVALLTPSQFAFAFTHRYEETDTILLDNSSTAHLHPATLRVPPGLWQSVEFHLTADTPIPIAATAAGFAVRLATASHSVDIHFALYVRSWDA